MARAHFLGFEEHFGLEVLFIDIDVRHLFAGAEGALYEELCVRRVVDYVDVFRYQSSRTMPCTRLPLTPTQAPYGVDAFVVALHCYLGSLAGHACYALDADESVVDFGNFGFEESLQECRTCA